MDISLRSKSVKDSSLPLDFVPIIGRSRMNRFASTRKIIRKMECFGWHFNNFSEKYESTTVTFYENSATASDNYSHWLRFVRPTCFVGNAFYNILEWFYTKLFWLYIIFQWLWLPALIIGIVLATTVGAVGVGVAIAVVPIAFLLLHGLIGIIGKKLSKKIIDAAKYCLELEGYEPCWGDTEEEFKEVVKRMRKNR